MTTATAIHTPRHQITFEDLKGLRAEGYIRDSTLDQRDGFGPDIQRRNEERFAQSYGLLLGDRWYTEFVSGRSVSKRTEFQKLLEDARLDRFDVLLVDHTSRFARNQADCIRYKEELQRSGKIVVFVSQGIISGSDRDFLAERINETLDEAYSRNLSRYVSAGYAEKASQGYANGPAPLGYRSDKLASGRRERKVPDPETMPVLKELLRCYAGGSYSLQTLADHLNAMAYRTSTGRLFTKTSIEAVLSNRFYEGKAIYHPGRPDEEVRDGIHDVAPEVKDLWLRCQGVRGRRHRSFLAGSAARRAASLSLRAHHRMLPMWGPVRGKVQQDPSRRGGPSPRSQQGPLQSETPLHSGGAPHGPVSRGSAALRGPRQELAGRGTSGHGPKS